jgi:hypothetical protein
MSINSITDRFGKKLNLYAENIDSEALLTNSVNATTVTADVLFSTSYSQSASDLTEIAATSLGPTLGDVAPVGFVSGIPASYTIHQDEKKAVNINTSMYKYTLSLKGLFDLSVGLPSAALQCVYSMTYPVDPRYLNASVIYKQGKALNILNSGNVYLDTPYLATVDTSVLGEMKLIFRLYSHINIPQASTLSNDFHIELVEA